MINQKPITLVDIVHDRMDAKEDRIAFTFLADGAADARSITWAQLHQHATALAASLSEQGAAGQPVLLALPSGLAFVESLLACWYAGSIPVPVSLPRHQRVKHRLDAIIADAGAHFAIGAPDTRERLLTSGSDEKLVSALSWINPERSAEEIKHSPDLPAHNQQVALLQYTSGSTGSPRGVVVTHANLMHNSAQIAEACGHRPGQTIGGWLPLFHDMGLIGMVIQTIYTGVRCVFMPPERFLMRPWLWLQMLTDYKICSTTAPNFAYDLCVDKIGPEHKASLNLTHWRNAINGSEPVRARTIDRFAAAFANCGFRKDAFFPCYGLAEATLFVTGPGANRSPSRRTAEGILLADNDPNGHVGCGQTFDDTQLAIVDPQSRHVLPPEEIGEIWVAGTSVARGYWNNTKATAVAFNAHLEGSNLTWLRTGDLGFVADNELFITGRLRELIIIAGRNHFPVDIERTVESADPAIATSGAVAFSVDTHGTERLIIVAEVQREFARPSRNGLPTGLDSTAVRRRISAAVAAENEVTPHEVILLRPGAVPRTTSGKVSRRATRDAYLNESLERLENANYASANT